MTLSRRGQSCGSSAGRTRAGEAAGWRLGWAGLGWAGGRAGAVCAGACSFCGRTWRLPLPPCLGRQLLFSVPLGAQRPLLKDPALAARPPCMHLACARIHPIACPVAHNALLPGSPSLPPSPLPSIAQPRKLDDLLASWGLGGVSDQLKDLRLGELLDTPPPGIDEAIAIAKVGLCSGRWWRW